MLQQTLKSKQKYCDFSQCFEINIVAYHFGIDFDQINNLYFPGLLGQMADIMELGHWWLTRLFTGGVQISAGQSGDYGVITKLLLVISWGLR